MKIKSNTGEIHKVRKYIISDQGEESVWCNSWNGRHVIGIHCEWYVEPTKSAEEVANKAINEYWGGGVTFDANDKFIEILARHIEQYASSQPVTVSEEEISNAAFDLSEKHPDIVAAITDNYFIKGAKWMQKQLTSPQREKDESKQMQQEAIKDRLKRNIGGEIPPRLGSGVNPPKK